MDNYYEQVINEIIKSTEKDKQNILDKLSEISCKTDDNDDQILELVSMLKDSNDILMSMKLIKEKVNFIKNGEHNNDI